MKTYDLTCDGCSQRNAIPTDEMTLVRYTVGIWTAEFVCPGCARTSVFQIPEALALAAESVGSTRTDVPVPAEFFEEHYGKNTIQTYEVEVFERSGLTYFHERLEAEVLP